MMKLGEEKEVLNVVNDQRGNPTNANDLAYHILKLIETEEYGVYHCTGKGECSWYEFAKEIMALSNRKCKVNPCTSQEYKTPAKRPEYSSLDNMMLRATVGDDMREWKEALKNFIKSIYYTPVDINMQVFCKKTGVTKRNINKKMSAPCGYDEIQEKKTADPDPDVTEKQSKL